MYFLLKCSKYLLVKNYSCTSKGNCAEQNEKQKYYTNIDDAREAGEKKRQEKERSLGPVVTLPSGIKFVFSI